MRARGLYPVMWFRSKLEELSVALRYNMTRLQKNRNSIGRNVEQRQGSRLQGKAPAPFLCITEFHSCSVPSRLPRPFHYTTSGSQISYVASVLSSLATSISRNSKYTKTTYQYLGNLSNRIPTTVVPCWLSLSGAFVSVEDGGIADNRQYHRVDGSFMTVRVDVGRDYAWSS